MEEKDISLKHLKESVNELLSIVEHAEIFPKESTQIRKYFIEKRDKICGLGKRIAILSGLASDSEEALRFGKLVVSNYLCSNAVSTKFLRDAFTSTNVKDKLKEEIVHFTRALLKYLEEDRKALQKLVQKEGEILKKLKESEKAAKHNPEWTREIESLERKIKNISKIITDKKDNEKDTNNKSILQIDNDTKRKNENQNNNLNNSLNEDQNNNLDEKSKVFIELLERLSRLKCFCSFKKNKKPSKYDILKELAVHIFETEKISYISVMPYICQAERKISIEMCSPDGIDSDFIESAKKYIEYILIEIVDNSTEVVAESIRESVKYYKKSGKYKKEHIKKIFVGIAPNRMLSIQKILLSSNDTVFYINIIRFIYLMIHDLAYDTMKSHRKTEEIDLPYIILRENRIYHKQLIKEWISSNPAQDERYTGLTNTDKTSRISLLYPILSNIPLSLDTFVLIRTISNGIFSDGNVLSEYYKEYHLLRVSVLRTILDIITKKISTEVYAQMASTKKEATKHRQKSTTHPPKELLSIVRRRILNTLHVLAIRFIRSKSIRLRTYISKIDTNEFVKRGLPVRHAELYMLLSLALPLFAFSSHILDESS